MYTNAQYMKNLNGDIEFIRCEINSEIWFIPVDESSFRYVAIMKLVEENKLTIAPAEETK